jgi:hypothetical protein
MTSLSNVAAVVSILESDRIVAAVMNTSFFQSDYSEIHNVISVTQIVRLIQYTDLRVFL